LAVLASVTLLGASPVIADDLIEWKGPGYYLVDGLGALHAGPYANEADCTPFETHPLPQDPDDARICEYLESDPFS
jgi:hypothetical protein